MEQREARERMLASLGPPPLGGGGDPISFCLRIDNLGYIEQVFGKGAADALYVEVCTLTGDLFSVPAWIGGSVRARSDGTIDIVAWPRGAVAENPAYVAETLCEGLMLTSFAWEGQALHVALSVARASQRPGEPDGQSESAHSRLGGVLPDGEVQPSSAAWRLQYRRDMRVAASLLRRLDAGDILLGWQPVAEAAEPDMVLYYEALARTIGPEGRLHAHREAVLALERLGLIRVFDQRVMSMVLDELDDHPAVRLGVNISARSAVLDPWWDRVRARLEANRSLGSRLVIEITETALLRPIPEVTAFIREMRRFGCRFALDDFGAGHASFRQLLSLSPDIVKIAPVFLQLHLPEQERSALPHLMGLARSLASMVVVKGVETEEQSNMAHVLGLVWQQGGYLGAPSYARPWWGYQRSTLTNERRAARLAALDGAAAGGAHA